MNITPQERQTTPVKLQSHEFEPAASNDFVCAKCSLARWAHVQEEVTGTWKEFATSRNLTLETLERKLPAKK